MLHPMVKVPLPQTTTVRPCPAPGQGQPYFCAGKPLQDSFFQKLGLRCWMIRNCWKHLACHLMYTIWLLQTVAKLHLFWKEPGWLDQQPGSSFFCHIGCWLEQPCFVKDCALHLHGSSSWDLYAPFYSSWISGVAFCRKSWLKGDKTGIHSLQGLANLHDHLGENCVGRGSPETIVICCRLWAMVD